MKDCTNPDIGRLMARYEFGKLTPEEKEKFEKHLLECNVCYEDFYSFSSAVRIIKDNLEDFAKAVKPKRNILSIFRVNPFSFIKSAIQNFERLLISVPRPLKAALPVAAVLIIIMLSLINRTAVHDENEFNLVVNDDPGQFVLHKPQMMESKTAIDSLSDINLNFKTLKDKFVNDFYKKITIIKSRNRDSLVIQWPFVRDCEYYSLYFTDEDEKEMITPYPGIADTLFIYPVKNIQRGQMVTMELVVSFANEIKFCFKKWFKIDQ